MKTQTPIDELIAYKKRTKIKWRIISTELGVEKFTLSRWVNGHHKPIPAHERMIKKFLKNNC